MTFKSIKWIKLILLVLFSTNAWSLFNICCPKPYLGLEAQLRHLRWSSFTGNHIFKRDLPQGNLYAGVNLNCFLGAEIGYESSYRRQRNLALNGGDIFLGTVLTPTTTPLLVSTEVGARGFHANIVGHYPIFCEELELFGHFGFTNIKLRHRYFILSSLTSASVVTGSQRTFEKNSWVPRAGLGLRQMVSDGVGVRAMVTWEKLTRFQNIYPTEIGPISALSVNALRSWIYSFGFFVNF